MDFTAKSFGELNCSELYEILKSRFEIFTLEQKILYQDMDDIDRDALHCFFSDGIRIIGYLRAYPYEGEKTVKIGRVLTLEHGTGLGKELMAKSLEAARVRFGCERIVVSAQKQAEGFYAKCGFVPTSEDFIEADIPHVMMELKLN